MAPKIVAPASSRDDVRAALAGVNARMAGVPQVPGGNPTARLIPTRQRPRGRVAAMLAHPLPATLCALLAVFACYTAIEAVFGFRRLDLIEQIGRGLPVSDDRIASSDSTATTLARIDLAFFVATAIVFIAWLYSVNRRVERLDGWFIHSPGWAIGGWFVPLLNLWRPEQMAQQSWRGSQVAEGSDQPPRWEATSPSRLIYWWWGAFLMGGFLLAGSNSSMNSASGPAIDTRGDSVELFATGIKFGLASEAAYIVAAALAVAMIVRVTRRQEVAAQSWSPQDSARTDDDDGETSDVTRQFKEFLAKASDAYVPEPTGALPDWSPAGTRPVERPTENDGDLRSPAGQLPASDRVTLTLTTLVLGGVASVLVVVLAVLATLVVARA